MRPARRPLLAYSTALTSVAALLVLVLPASAQDSAGNTEPPAAATPLPEPAAQDPGPAASAPAPDGTCTKDEFESAVDEAAAVLRDLNQKNKPHLQEKLKQLKAKRGWSQDQFLREAAPFVKDDQIDAFDNRTGVLLGMITSMGEEGSAGAAPDCAMLGTLRGHMTALIETQNAKWTHIFSKVDAELTK